MKWIKTPDQINIVAVIHGAQKTLCPEEDEE
jgi:hypothetical protein